jgi:hypothetical protein
MSFLEAVASTASSGFHSWVGCVQQLYMVWGYMAGVAEWVQLLLVAGLLVALVMSYDFAYDIRLLHCIGS